MSENLSQLADDQWLSAVANVAIAARPLLETYGWSPETAFQGITVTEEDVASRGQCGVSSLWVARHLRDKGAEAYFTEGRIQVDQLNEPFVWVEVRRPDGPPIVVDVTSDQYQSTNGALVHVGRYNSGQGTIGHYDPEQWFDPYNMPHRKLLGRFAILEANMARPAWRRHWPFQR